MKKTLAIFSPNQNAYSETFIQAHKQLRFDVKFYYGGWLPTKLENEKNIFEFSLLERIRIRMQRHLTNSEYALALSLKKQNVDVILAEYGPTGCAVLKVVEYLKIPLVVHFHGFDASHHKTLAEYKEQYKILFNYASSIIAVSNKMKIDLIRMGCPENKITLATYGPDKSFLEVIPSYNTQQFVAVGRFVDKKAPYLTIAAFKKVLESQPGARMVMVGDGPLLNTCKNLARSMGVLNSIEFRGILSADEIKVLFSQSIAFVQHSITSDEGDAEGTPVAILEAQAASLPVIATIHAGIPDVVVNNETGLLVDEHDVDGMANNMLAILLQNGLAKRLGEAGKTRVQKKFSLEKHLDILENVLGNSILQQSIKE